MIRLLISAFFGSALLVSLPLQADQFVNGRPAVSVLGQTDFTSGDPSSFPNRFNNPRGVAVDAATGKVFVADTLNHRILRFSSTSALANGSFPEAVIGQADFTGKDANQGGPAGQRTLNSPVQIVVDHQGRLWVADANNHRVLCYVGASSAGNLRAADFVFGQPNFTTVMAGVTQAKMDSPAGVAVGTDDTLWVADTSNSRVLRFDNVSTKSSGSPADGVLGQSLFTTDADGGGPTGMDLPNAVSVDPAGRLWVSDQFNRRVLRFDAAASLADGAPANGVLGQVDFVNVSPGIGSARFAFTFGVVAGPDGTVYVADFNNCRVMGFRNAAAKANGAAADFVLCQPDFATNSSGLSDLKTAGTGNLCLTPEGHLWVVDINNHRVLRFVPVTPPTLTIQTRSTRTSASSFTIRGTSSGETSSVTYRVGNSGAFKGAKGSSSWNFKAKLKNGKNVITVIARGPGGSSVAKTVTITRT